MVVALSTVVAKGLGSRGAHTDEQMVGVVFASTQYPPVQAETSPGPEVGVLDVTLPGHAGIVDHVNVYGLLAECLQDVSFAALSLRISLLIVLFLTLDYF
jgi:hypothetical protein